MKHCMKNGIIIIYLSLLLPFFIYAGEKTSTWNPKPDEFIELRLQVKDVGRTEVTAIIHEKRVYLPVTACFKYLLINVAYDSTRNTAAGYYLTSDVRYTIDGLNRVASINKKKIQLAENDFFAASDELYLAIEQFDPIFGLKFVYNERLLRLELTPPRTLPIFTIIQRDRQRKYSKGLEDPKYASTVLPEKYPLFGAGILDWDFISRQRRYGLPSIRFRLKSGSQFLGGDLVLNGNGVIARYIKPYRIPNTNRIVRKSVAYPITTRNIRGTLTYARFEYPYLKQIILGDFTPFGILGENVFGGEITNRPAAKRTLFAEDIFEQKLDADQTLDVYSSGKILSTQYSTDGGTFQNMIPLRYGMNIIELRTYDRWGAERINAYRPYIPLKLLRPQEFIYSLSAGKLRMLNRQWYFNGTASWGLNTRLTMGGTLETFELPNTNNKIFPAIFSTARLSNELVFDGMFSPNAISRGTLSLLLPSTAGGSLSLTHYARNYFLNTRNVRTAINLTASLPFFFAGTNLFLINGSAQQLDGYFARYRSASGELSFYIKNVQPRLGVTASWSNEYTPSDSLVILNLFGGLRMRLPLDIVFGMEGRYDYIKEHMLSVNFQVNRYIIPTLVGSISFNKFYARTWEIELQLNYVLPFVHLQTIVRKVDSDYSYSERANGSIIYSGYENNFRFDNVPARVGFGDLVLNPFFDANNDETFDPSEERVLLKRVRGFTEGGNVGTSNPIPGRFEVKRASAYDTYRIYYETEGLDNPVWVPKFSSLAIKSFPNMVQRIDVPIVEGGIVRGKVVETARENIDLEGITVVIESQDSIRVQGKNNASHRKTMQTFSTGEFEFFPIPPGRYTVMLDRDQIEKVGYRTDRYEYQIEVKVVAGGDVIEGLNFALTR